MNNKEHKAYLKQYKSYLKKNTSSPEASKNFLIDLGVNTPTGRLTKAYSPPKPIKVK